MSEAETTLFVAGATGYTGREVVRQGVRDGFRVVAHIRPGSASGERSAQAFEALGATVDRTTWEADAMQRALLRHQPDVVFGLLGTTRARGKEAAAKGSVETYETIDYGLTSLLLHALHGACHDIEHPSRFVYLSSMGVSATTRNPYLVVRHRVESELRELADHLFSYTSVRPAFISGTDREESRPLERFGARLGDALLGTLGALGASKAEAKYKSITAAALAQNLIRLGLDERARDRVVAADELTRLTVV